FVDIEPRGAGLALDGFPVACDDAREPALDLLGDEVDVLGGIVGTDLDGLALGVRPAGGVDDVEDDVGAREFVEELVAEAPAYVRARYQPGDVEQFDRDIAGTVVAVFVATALVGREAGTVGADVR